MEIKIKKDEHLKKLAAKYGTNQTDSDTLNPTKKNIEGIIGDLTTIPKKLNLVGPIGMTSNRKSKVNENTLSGKNGRNMLKDGNNSDKERINEGI